VPGLAREKALQKQLLKTPVPKGNKPISVRTSTLRNPLVDLDKPIERMTNEQLELHNKYLKKYIVEHKIA